jgi:hypothetical protein
VQEEQDGISSVMTPDEDPLTHATDQDRFE